MSGRRISRQLPRQVGRATAVLLLSTLALLLGGAPAFAHSRLDSSDPADGSSVDTAPDHVSLTFNETMSSEFSTMLVVGPSESQYQSGPVSAQDGTITTAVNPLGPAGRYEIRYRVVSADGHPVTGSVAFTLTTPGPGTGTAPAATTDPAAGSAPSAGTPAAPAPALPADAVATEDGGGAPIWPWIVGAVVLVGAGVVAALRLGRG